MVPPLMCSQQTTSPLARQGLPAYTHPHQWTPSLHTPTPVDSQLTHTHTSGLPAYTHPHQWTHCSHMDTHNTRHTDLRCLCPPTPTHIFVCGTLLHSVWHANVLQPTCTCSCIRHMRVQLIKVECVVKLNRRG